MELVTKQLPDGTYLFFVRCEIHNWFYKGLPPITTGCPNCWLAYFFATHSRTPTSKQELALAQLESAVHHAAEHEDAGTWDFVPEAPGKGIEITTDEDLPFKIEEYDA